VISEKCQSFVEMRTDLFFKGKKISGKDKGERSKEKGSRIKIVGG
jgi:hypothetical protein